VTRYCASLFAAGRRFDLVPTRANGQPAFGAYLRVPAGIRHATGFYVLTLAGDRICAMTRFEASVLPWFGLPAIAPGPVISLGAAIVSSSGPGWGMRHRIPEPQQDPRPIRRGGRHAGSRRSGGHRR
jgi:hypothetical protein